MATYWEDAWEKEEPEHPSRPNVKEIKAMGRRCVVRVRMPTPDGF
jgi:hypothetical protein